VPSVPAVKACVPRGWKCAAHTRPSWPRITWRRPGPAAGAPAARAGESGTRIPRATARAAAACALGTDALKAGIYVGASVPWSATVSFYDAAHDLLGTEYLGGTGRAFAGWQADTGLVHQIQIVDTSAQLQSLFIKDLETENNAPGVVPEPASLILLGVGAVGLGGFAWRRGPVRPVPGR
jgi:hypothetical protein